MKGRSIHDTLRKSTHIYEIAEGGIVGTARVKGLDWLEADVLSRNRPMLNVFRRCGLPMAMRHESDVIHVILSLREAG